MEKARIEVFVRDGRWAIRYYNTAGEAEGNSSWATLEEAVDVALAQAEERWRRNKESVDIFYEETGRFVLYNKGFRHFT